MSAPTNLLIRPFEPADQDDARRLLAAGYREHFGPAYDEAQDPALADAAALFSNGVFLVAVLDGRIAATGALLVQDGETAEVMRMSTAREQRRRGIGAAVLDRLLDEARARGCRRVVLGTEAAWEDSVSFYRAQGFRETHRVGGTSIWFELKL